MAGDMLRLELLVILRHCSYMSFVTKGETDIVEASEREARAKPRSASWYRHAEVQPHMHTWFFVT